MRSPSPGPGSGGAAARARARRRPRRRIVSHRRRRRRSSASGRRLRPAPRRASSALVASAVSPRRRASASRRTVASASPARLGLAADPSPPRSPGRSRRRSRPRGARCRRCSWRPPLLPRAAVPPESACAPLARRPAAGQAGAWRSGATWRRRWPRRGRPARAARCRWARSWSTPAGRVVAAAGNRTRELADPTAHAEMLALRAACAAAGSERLPGHSLWVTLEPCPMCAAAIGFARIATLYIGARGPQVRRGPARPAHLRPPPGPPRPRGGRGPDARRRARRSCAASSPSLRES